MKAPEFFVVKKKKSPLKLIIVIVSAIIAIATAILVAYKFIINKTKAKFLGRVDIDGDGETEAVMLDTTGNGEVDTIIINSPDFEDEK